MDHLQLIFLQAGAHPAKKRLPSEKVIQSHPIIGVAYKDKSDQLAIFLERFGDPFIKIGFDNDGKTSINWGVYGIPETFLISNEGKIIARHAGEITNEVLNSLLILLLKKR